MPSNKVILLVGRDNWQKDDELNHILLKNLKQYDYKIIWEDPAGNLIYKFRRLENKLKWLPEPVKRFDLRFIQFLYGLSHWSYFSYLAGRQNIAVDLRCRKLRQSILQLGNKNEIVILSRSSGGRIASIIADELNIKHIICLSYPFKHPKMDAEPGRYIHLKNLETPMLIIQGTEDEYGGIDVKEKYAFSESIELLFVNAKHDFKINAEDWKRVLQKMDEVLNQS